MLTVVLLLSLFLGLLVLSLLLYGIRKYTKITWDYNCIASALCFLASNIFFIVHSVLMMKDSQDPQNDYWDKEHGMIDPTSFNYEYWTQLDPIYIESRWMNREQSRPAMMSAALFGAIAWFWLIVPIVQSAWVLSRGGKRQVGAHMLLAAMAICGGIIELLSRLLTVGMTNASQWLVKDFNLDNWGPNGTYDGAGWRVLEMIHIVTRGMLLWVDAFEALALFGIVVVIFYSVVTEPKFESKEISSILRKQSSSNLGEDEDSADTASGSSTAAREALASPPQPAFAGASMKVPVIPTFTKCFAGYGVFVGILALVDFVAAVLRFLDWKLFGRIAMVTNALLGVIFLPIWLLCLARQLPEATERFERAEKRGMIVSDDEMTSVRRGSERDIS